MTTATLEKRENLSTVVAALEKAHDLIREETGAPRATISIGRSAKVHGHFTPWTPWQSEGESFHEIFLSASSFQRGARATLGTLLHETAHSLDNQAGRQGTSGDGYHNKIFKKTAEELGLKMEQVKGKGYTDTIVSDECVARWQEAHDLIEAALNLMATADDSARPKSRNKNLLVAECACGEKIRLSLKTLEKCQPICTECESFFTVQEA
jgi:hypothetical protein